MTSPLTPLISVVMTNKNDARWISQSIRSVLSNTYRNFELIVVDDGSDDESPDIIRLLAAEDSRIRPVFLRKNLGTSASRNIGIEESRGEYVTLLDSDDCHLAYTLERMMQSYEEAAINVNEISLLVSDAYLINERGIIKGRYMSRKWHGMMILDRRDGDPDTDWKRVSNNGMQLVYKASPKWCLPSTHFLNALYLSDFQKSTASLIRQFSWLEWKASEELSM